MSNHATASLENKLREKWQEIPATRQDRAFSSDLLNWPDEQLLDYWEECRRQTTTPDVRGWFQDLYKNDFIGLDVADVGPGVGVDGIYFAQHGANLTFVDIVEDNLKLLERICSLKGIKADFYFIDDFFSYHFKKKFDVFLFIGSMINAPFDFTQRQLEALLTFLRPGGKVLMLAYPEERFITSGTKDQAEFAKTTDGERTPWIEWYNDEKIKHLYGPGYNLNWSRNFGKDDIEFNWFELTKLEKDSCQQQAATSTSAEFIQNFPIIHVFDLPTAIASSLTLDTSRLSLNKPFSAWRMQTDDSPILRYLYRHFQPKRHLEFGTWLGEGVTYCLEETEATVWTVNLPFGDASSSYGFYTEDIPDAQRWAEKIGLPVRNSYTSDAIGFIGKAYLEKGYGRRVCQIYADSREWDTSAYPGGFFDSILIDGGHTKEIVISDTHKALPLLRSGGLMLWHDFCPPMYGRNENTREVIEAISAEWDLISTQMAKVFWIYPSWILIGIKK